MYGGSGGGWMILGWLWMALVVLAPVLLLLALFRYVFSWPGRPRDAGSRALDILDEAYARGEIPREEYLQKRADLKGR
jgi:putative membrane protein